MTNCKTFLLAAGAALALALPAAAQAQADQAPDGAKAYPPCSATVTDGCMQHGGGSHAKTHHAKPAHHKASRKG